MSPIHDRMPVILAPRDYARWLDRDTPGTAVADLIQSYEWEGFEATPVSTTVNSPHNDDETCIAPLAEWVGPIGSNFLVPYVSSSPDRPSPRATST